MARRHPRALGVAVLAAASMGCESRDGAPPSPAQVIASPGAVRYAETREAVTDLAREAMRVHDVTGVSVALVDGTQIVWAMGFGHADRAHDTLASEHTVYRAGSIAKTIVVLALLRLAERRQLDLDAPVTEVLPQLKLRRRSKRDPPPTVRQIMAHHAGLPSDLLRGMWDPTPSPWRDLITELAEVDLPYRPGEVTAYSNVGFAVLGRVIEQVTGEDFVEHVTANVLAPAGMTTASFVPPRDVAQAYRLGEPADEPPMRLTPAGGLFASVTDLAQLIKVVFARGQVDGRPIVQPSSVAEMLRPQNDGIALDLDAKMGLGLSLTRAELAYAGPVAWQVSWTPHFHGQIMMLVEHELGVAVLSNSFTGARVVDPIAIEALQSALQEKVGTDPPDPAGPVATPAAVPPATLAAFAGVYATDQSTLRIEVRDAMLVSHSLAGTAQLHPLADGRFEVRGIPGLSLSFEHIEGRDLIVTHQHGVRGYLAQRIEPGPISEPWRRRLGPLVVANPGDDFPVLKNPHLREQDGLLELGYDFLLPHPSIPVSMVLEPRSPKHADIVGLGRGKGEIVRVVRRGAEERLLWSGYEFRRRGED